MVDGPTNSTERRGTYVGPLTLLKGEKATVISYEGSPRCLAKFDNLETGYSLAFHDFQSTHFELEA